MLEAKGGNECMKQGEEEGEKKERNWVSELQTNLLC